MTIYLQRGYAGPWARPWQEFLRSKKLFPAGVKLADVFGPSSEAGTKTAQVEWGLDPVDGKVGDDTTAAAVVRGFDPPWLAKIPKLDAAANHLDTSTEPLWLTLAKKEIGTREIPGPNDNPRVLWYMAATSYAATNDEVPWCAGFVSRMLQEAGIKDTDSARARSYEEWGVPLNVPVPGCIVTFWRGKTKDAPQGHVGFYVGGDPTTGFIAVLGGNQGNMVKVGVYKTDRITGYRWAPGVQPPSSVLIAAALAQSAGEVAEGAASWA